MQQNRLSDTKKFRKHVRKPFANVVIHAQYVLDCLLENSELGINEIFAKIQSRGQTGFHFKRDTLDAVSYLEEMNLISKSKDQYHSQKLIHKLTSSGINVAVFRSAVYGFINSFDKLTDVYKQLHLQKDRKTLNSEEKEQVKAIRQEWPTETDPLSIITKNRNPTYSIKRGLLETLTTHFILILVYRYRVLLIENKSDLSRALIDNMMTNFIVEVVNRIQFLFTLPDVEEDLADFSQKFINEALKDVEMSVAGGAFTFKQINKEVEEFLVSFLQVVGPNNVIMQENWSESRLAEFGKPEDKEKWKGYDYPDFHSSDPFWVLSLSNFYQKIITSFSR
jgi:hypothetical protein